MVKTFDSKVQSSHNAPYTNFIETGFKESTLHNGKESCVYLLTSVQNKSKLILTLHTGKYEQCSLNTQ